MTSIQTTARFVPKICVHIPSPWETPTDRRCSHASVGHREVITPVMAKRGGKHVEESFPHVVKHAGNVPIPLMFQNIVDFGKSVVAANSRIICRLIAEMPNTFDCTSSIALGRLPQLPSWQRWMSKAPGLEIFARKVAPIRRIILELQP